MNAIWMVILSMPWFMGISPSLCTSELGMKSFSSPTRRILPFFLMMLRWMTPPIAALKNPSAATERPKLLPPSKPYCVS